MYLHGIEPSRNTLTANFDVRDILRAIDLQVDAQEKRLDFYEEQVKKAEQNQQQIKASYPEDVPDDPTAEQLLSNKFNSYASTVENQLNQAKQKVTEAKNHVRDLQRWQRFFKTRMSDDENVMVPLTFKDMEYFKL